MPYFRFMIRVLCISLLLFLSCNGTAQNQFLQDADTLNKKRLIGISTGVGTVWTGSMIGLSQVWYKGVEKTSWHTFDDSRNWLHMDKVGHFYTAYKINQLTTDLFRWSGVKHKTSVWTGAGISIGYQTTLEFFDAYSVEWGFSWADVASNTVGTFFYTGQQLLWKEERFIPKFSYHPTDFTSVRPQVLGSSFAESLLKDYNGQTYWLSFSPGTFFKNSKFPKWACISLGYSVHEKLVGDQEYYLDNTTGQEYLSKREFLLSLDIDFSRIPIKRPWLKAIVKQFNYLKIPFPALIIRGNQVTGSALYF